MLFPKDVRVTPNLVRDIAREFSHANITALPATPRLESETGNIVNMYVQHPRPDEHIIRLFNRTAKEFTSTEYGGLGRPIEGLVWAIAHEVAHVELEHGNPWGTWARTFALNPSIYQLQQREIDADTWALQKMKAKGYNVLKALRWTVLNANEEGNWNQEADTHPSMRERMENMLQVAGLTWEDVQ